MPFDLSILLPAMVVTVAAISVLFFVDKFRKPTESAGRYWAVVFVAATLSTVAYFVSGRTDDVWWSVAVGNSMMVLTLGALWSGCRAFNGRRSHLWLVLVVTAVVALTATMPSAEGPKWAGAAEKMLGLALFSVLIVVESLRPRLRGYLGARILTVVLSVHSVYILLRSAAYLAGGPESDLYSTWFGTAFVTAMNLVLVLCGGAGIIAVRVQESRATYSRVSPDGRRQRFEERSVFIRQASARLDGGDGARDAGLLLLVAGVDLLPDLRGAYGVAHANRLLATLARSIVRQVPADALLARLPGDRFAVLLGASGIAEGVRLAEAVQAGYRAETAGDEDASDVSVGLSEHRPRDGGALDDPVPSAVLLARLIEAAGLALGRDAHLRLGRIGLADRR